METLSIDQALMTAQSTGDSIIQGLIIICALGFVIWNVKLAFDTID